MTSTIYIEMTSESVLKKDTCDEIISVPVLILHLVEWSSNLVRVLCQWTPNVMNSTIGQEKFEKKFLKVVNKIGESISSFTGPIVEVITFGVLSQRTRTLLPSSEGYYTKNEAINKWKSTSGTYPWSFVTQLFHSGQPSHCGNRKTFEVMTST